MEYISVLLKPDVAPNDNPFPANGADAPTIVPLRP